jgi:hypothetical protein
MVFRRNRRFFAQDAPVDMEVSLVTHIAKTGKEQIKRRKKAGLSVYYLKGDSLVELKPNKTEVELKKIKSKWISLDKEKRTLILK